MPTESATFVISIDLEMSWGAVHHGRPHDDGPYQREREVVETLLRVMERYDIAATWAIVGHLFLTECAPVDGVKHAEIVRPDYSWLEGDWYDLDPAATLEAAPTWYGRDLVEMITGSPVSHEVGSHSFGHVIAGDPGCSAEAFRTDLNAAREVAAAAGLEVRSFVYPRNSIGHLDVLRDSGFVAYRGPAPTRFADLAGVRRRLALAVDAVRPLRGEVVRPAVRHGMVDVPQTYLFDPDSRRARRWGTAAWAVAVRRRLRHAVRSASLFHLWFHTHNLAAAPDRAWKTLDVLFRDARRHIDAGRLDNLTMGAVAERWRGTNAPS